MRLLFLLALITLVVANSGCTHLSLQRNTIKQASTLTDLQYQQVLDNLAMFACNPDALPWHLKLSAATTQISDEGRGFLGFVFGPDPATFLPSAEGARGVVEAWSGVPAVDADDLEVLQLAYRRAIDPTGGLGVPPKIYEKIAELSLAYNIALSEEALNQVIDSVQPEQPDSDLDAKRWDWKRRNAELRKKLDEQYGLLVQASNLNFVAEADSKVGNTDDKQYAARKLALTAGRAGVEDEIVKLTREIIDLPFVPRYPISGRPEHNIHEVDQIQAKIKTLDEMANPTGKFAQPWFHIGHSKKDVPKCACYVAHACSCGCECWVWIMPEERAMLRDFTIAILTLAPMERTENTVPLPGGGIMYSPTLR